MREIGLRDRCVLLPPLSLSPSLFRDNWIVRLWRCGSRGSVGPRPWRGKMHDDVSSAAEQPFSCVVGNKSAPASPVARAKYSISSQHQVARGTWGSWVARGTNSGNLTRHARPTTLVDTRNKHQPSSLSPGSRGRPCFPIPAHSLTCRI